MKAVILPVVLSVFLGSCAIHHMGSVANSAALTTNNFTYQVHGAEGTAQAVYLFGLGGLGRNALETEARKNLLENYPLKANQALVNVTVSYKTTFAFIVLVRRCTVSASVVEFFGTESEN